MSDFGDSFSTTSDNKGDKELQEFLMVEKQKAQFNAQVSSIHTRDILNNVYFY